VLSSISYAVFFVLIPLTKYPKIRQFHVHQKGTLDAYTYEVRCNGRRGKEIVPFSFALLYKRNIVMVIQHESVEELLQQVFLRVYTALGTRVELVPMPLEEQIACALDIAKAYIHDPQSFVEEIPENESITPPLDYFPLLRSSQLIETSSIGAYRYELHTRCSSMQRIQYHHVLFCYAPFQKKPCFVVSAESFGGVGPSLGVFHDNGHSNLGVKPNLITLEVFREEAFALVRKELLKESETEEFNVPNFEQGLLIEKGLIGRYRCALYTDIPGQEQSLFFHVFALYVASMNKPNFVFVMEKRKNDPTPKLILYRDGERHDLGFEESLLDVKLFRDRVVVLLKLILVEEERHNVDISVTSASILLRIQQFLELTFVGLVSSLSVLSLGAFITVDAALSHDVLYLLSMGIHGATLFFASLSMLFARIPRTHIAFVLLVLALPLYKMMLLPFALFAFYLMHHFLLRYFLHHNLDYNGFGLSYAAKQKLRNIIDTQPLE